MAMETILSEQNVWRSVWPNTLQCKSSSSCTPGTPAGLPGRGEVIEGVMQQAAQRLRANGGDSALARINNVDTWGARAINCDKRKL